VHRLFCVLQLTLFVAAACFATAQPARSQLAIDHHVTIAGRGTASLRLHAQEIGAGPPVLLLHGLAGSTYSWRFVAPRLAAAGYRVIALDLKGFGASGKPLDEDYDIVDHAQVVRSFLAAMGLRHISVVGHSMGGLVGLALASGADGGSSALVDRLVLISTPAFPQEIAPGLQLLQQPVLPRVLLAVLPAEWPVAIALAMEQRTASGVRGADVAAYAGPLNSPGGAHALVATAAHLVPADAASLTATYARLSQPTLVMSCLDDGIVPPSTAVRLSRTLPHARLDLLEGCRHLAPEQVPDAISTAIAQFLVRR
jgi:pimeloyl-ACP methyl ester carboxylesterase